MTIKQRLALMAEMKKLNDKRVHEYLKVHKKAVSENGTMAPVHG